MAKIIEFTPEQQQEFDAWVSERPQLIQDMIRKLPPDRLYRNKKTGQRMCLVSYEEDGTVTASVSSQYNSCLFERNVFGIHMDDLEECDLPTSDEKLGAVLTEPEEVNAFIDATRPDVLKWKNQQNLN